MTDKFFTEKSLTSLDSFQSKRIFRKISGEKLNNPSISQHQASLNKNKYSRPLSEFKFAVETTISNAQKWNDESV
uniref:Uncharacterized protein n=1 Tax=Onchocerca volvulus TaxID=6282 RepID=A0A8R1XUN4_ONCVO